MARTLPISEVKARLPELVTGVEEREEEIVVTRRGKPAAVLVNFGEYERLKETLDVLSDADLMGQIRQSRRFYAAEGAGFSLEQVFDEPNRPKKKRAR
jgi:antitoxin YefM